MIWIRNRYQHSFILAVSVMCLMSLAGCEEDVQIDYSNFDHRLVIFSTMNPEEPMRVRVTASQNPTDTLDEYVPKFLEVSLSTHPSNNITLQLGQDGYFQPSQPIFPLEGTEIKVTASAPGFESAQSLTRIPFSSSVESAAFNNFRKEPAETSDFQTNVFYDFVLYMDHGDNRYYHISFIQALTNRGQDTILGTDDDTVIAYYLNPDEPLLPGIIRHHEAGILIDAENYNVNTAYNLHFSDFFFYNEVPGNFIFEIKTVSEDYYHYYSSLSKQLQSRNDPFAEPIPLYSNVLGGTGVLAGYDRLVDFRRLPY